MASSPTRDEWIEELASLLATRHTGQERSHAASWVPPENPGYTPKHYFSELSEIPESFRRAVALAQDLAPESEAAKRLRLVHQVLMLAAFELEDDGLERAVSQMMYDYENGAMDRAREKLEAWIP